MIKNNRTISTLVLSSFIFNAAITDLGFSQPQEIQAGADNLAVSSRFDDMSERGAADATKVKAALQGQLLRLAGNAKEPVDIKALFARTYTSKDSAALRLSLTNVRLFTHELVSLPNGYVAVMCRVLDPEKARKSSTYYAVISPGRDEYGKFPIDVYTEEEYAKEYRDARRASASASSSGASISPLIGFKEINQKIWLDGLTWEMMQNGEFETLVREHNITGVTTNPTLIKAYLKDEDVLARIGELAARGHKRDDIYYEIIKELAIAAIDVFKRYDINGKFSVELNPEKADDVNASVEEARMWTDIAPEYIMVKVPATEAGYRIVEEVTAMGRNANATLIFTDEQYRRIAEAYIRGLERAMEDGKDISKIYSVASFFVSRWDVELAHAIPRHLHGKLANGIATHSYNHTFVNLFTSPGFTALEKKGAWPQGFLLASTGSKADKMPNEYQHLYPADIYVQPVMGSNVVNTLPLGTIRALIEKPIAVLSETIVENSESAEEVIAQMRNFAEIEAVGTKLFEEGKKAFANDFSAIMATIDTAIGESKSSRASASGEGIGGLALTRKPTQSIVIGDDLTLTFLAIDDHGRIVVQAEGPSAMLTDDRDAVVMAGDERLRRIIYSKRHEENITFKFGVDTIIVHVNRHRSDDMKFIVDAPSKIRVDREEVRIRHLRGVKVKGIKGLTLTRHSGERIVIGDDLTLTFLTIAADKKIQVQATGPSNVLTDTRGIISIEEKYKLKNIIYSRSDNENITFTMGKDAVIAHVRRGVSEGEVVVKFIVDAPSHIRVDREEVRKAKEKEAKEKAAQEARETSELSEEPPNEGRASSSGGELEGRAPDERVKRKTELLPELTGLYKAELARLSELEAELCGYDMKDVAKWRDRNRERLARLQYLAWQNVNIDLVEKAWKLEGLYVPPDRRALQEAYLDMAKRAQKEAEAIAVANPQLLRPTATSSRQTITDSTGRSHTMLVPANFLQPVSRIDEARKGVILVFSEAPLIGDAISQKLIDMGYGVILTENKDVACLIAEIYPIEAVVTYSTEQRVWSDDAGDVHGSARRLSDRYAIYGTNPVMAVKLPSELPSGRAIEVVRYKELGKIGDELKQEIRKGLIERPDKDEPRLPRASSSGANSLELEKVLDEKSSGYQATISQDGFTIGINAELFPDDPKNQYLQKGRAFVIVRIVDEDRSRPIAYQVLYPTEDGYRLQAAARKKKGKTILLPKLADDIRQLLEEYAIDSEDMGFNIRSYEQLESRKAHVIFQRALNDGKPILIAFAEAMLAMPDEVNASYVESFFTQQLKRKAASYINTSYKIWKDLKARLDIVARYEELRKSQSELIAFDTLMNEMRKAASKDVKPLIGARNVEGVLTGLGIKGASYINTSYKIWKDLKARLDIVARYEELRKSQPELIAFDTLMNEMREAASSEDVKKLIGARNVEGVLTGLDIKGASYISISYKIWEDLKARLDIVARYEELCQSQSELIAFDTLMNKMREAASKNVKPLIGARNVEGVLTGLGIKGASYISTSYKIWEDLKGKLDIVSKYNELLLTVSNDATQARALLTKEIISLISPDIGIDITDATIKELLTRLRPPTLPAPDAEPEPTAQRLEPPPIRQSSSGVQALELRLEEINAMNKAAPAIGKEIWEQAITYNLLLPFEFYANGEFDKHKSKYGDRFILERVGRTSGNIDEYITNVLAKVKEGEEDRTVALLPSTPSLTPEQLERLKARNIRFVLMNLEDILSIKEKADGERMRFQEHTYATMLLFRYLDQNTVTDARIYSAISFYLRSHFGFTDEVALKAYIDAIVRSEVAQLIKAYLSYKQFVIYDAAEEHRTISTYLIFA